MDEPAREKESNKICVLFRSSKRRAAYLWVVTYDDGIYTLEGTKFSRKGIRRTYRIPESCCSSHVLQASKKSCLDQKDFSRFSSIILAISTLGGLNTSRCLSNEASRNLDLSPIFAEQKHASGRGIRITSMHAASLSISPPRLRWRMQGME